LYALLLSPTDRRRRRADVGDSRLGTPNNKAGVDTDGEQADRDGDDADNDDGDDDDDDDDDDEEQAVSEDGVEASEKSSALSRLRRLGDDDNKRAVSEWWAGDADNMVFDERVNDGEGVSLRTRGSRNLANDRRVMAITITSERIVSSSPSPSNRSTSSMVDSSSEVTRPSSIDANESSGWSSDIGEGGRKKGARDSTRMDDGWA
jgi:hypothetical protein